MSSWSIQRRIVTVTAVTLGVALLLGVVAFAVSLDRILYVSARDAAEQKATQIAQALNGQTSSAQATVNQFTNRGDLVQVVGPSGSVLASSEVALQKDRIADTATDAGHVKVFQSATVPGELGEPHAVATVGVRINDGGIGTVIVAKSLQVESSTVKTATALLGAGSALLLGLVIWLVSRGVRRALEPVEDIRAEVDQITAVRGSGRVTIPASGDEVARLATTMNEMLDRLAQADVATRQFVSDASHELRSPMATIRASLEIAPGPTQQARAERDAVILAETIRLQQLVNDLLTLAKSDDRAPRRNRDVDLDEIGAGEVRRIRATTPMTVDAHIEPVRVGGDDAQITHLFRNLVDNATRHAKHRIAIEVRGDGPEAVVRVDNDGPPIPVADRERVFGRFTRLDEARDRDRGGSGLGLAIVKSVATEHGGTVTTTQSPQGGCRFEVRLPRQMAPDPDQGR